MRRLIVTTLTLGLLFTGSAAMALQVWGHTFLSSSSGRMNVFAESQSDMVTYYIAVRTALYVNGNLHSTLKNYKYDANSVSLSSSPFCGPSSQWVGNSLHEAYDYELFGTGSDSQASATCTDSTKATTSVISSVGSPWAPEVERRILAQYAGTITPENWQRASDYMQVGNHDLVSSVFQLDAEHQQEGNWYPQVWLSPDHRQAFIAIRLADGHLVTRLVSIAR